MVVSNGMWVGAEKKNDKETILSSDNYMSTPLHSTTKNSGKKEPRYVVMSHFLELRVRSWC